MKVAFATVDGDSVDEHFGRAGMFAIYEVGRDGHRFVEMRKFAESRDRAVAETRGAGPAHDSAVQDKVEKLADCKLIYLTEIGGPSAARLVQRGIMPLKVKEVTTIESALLQLDQMIQKSPAPWLKKAMHKE
jgi:nitrogen fixation protein NifX